MDTSKTLTAGQWINTAKEQEIADVLYQYGEEIYSRRIAKFIVEARQAATLDSTLKLAEIIKTAHPKWPKNIHPATKSFMGIRLFINQELEALSLLLDQILDYLNLHSRLVVISFHSLEDRIVKNFMNKYSGKQYDPVVSKLPIIHSDLENIAKLRIIQKPLKAASVVNELEHNNRARSAILRVAERI
jgi:16S rRNA (cytosine1402-N4)-methyltransferase